jgi:hypothetical protein
MPTTGRNLVLRELANYEGSAAEMVQLVALNRGPGAVLNCKTLCINTRPNNGLGARFSSLQLIKEFNDNAGRAENLHI